jgi:hypothetical protein
MQILRTLGEASVKVTPNWTEQPSCPTVNRRKIEIPRMEFSCLESWLAIFFILPDRTVGY